MALILQAVSFVLFLYLIAMIARLVVGWIQVFARDWNPTGVLVVIVEFIFSITDPPIRAVRKVVPPLRLGGVAIDLAFMIVLFGLYILMGLVSALAGSVQ